MPPPFYHLPSSSPAMTRLPIREESQRRLNEGDPRWKAKAVLRIISTLLAFLAMILFAISVGMTVHWENVWNNGYGNDWTDGMPLAPVCNPTAHGLGHHCTNTLPLSGSPRTPIQPHRTLPTHPLPPRQILPPRIQSCLRSHHLGARISQHCLLRRRWLVLVVAASRARNRDPCRRSYSLRRVQFLVEGMPAGDIHYRED